MHTTYLAWARFINEVFMPAVNTLGCHAYLAPQFKDRDLAPFEPLLARIPKTYLQEGWRRALTDSLQFIDGTDAGSGERRPRPVSSTG
jgi:hypothetical protein